MYKKMIYLITIILMFVLNLSLVNAQDKFKLEYKFEKGKTYLFQDITTGDVTQEMMGREMKMHNESNSIVRIVVDEVDNDKNISLIISSDSITVRSKTPMGDTSMVLNELIGKRTKILVSNIGKIIKRETLDSIRLRGRMAMNTMREAISFPILPEQPMGIGEKWQGTYTDSMMSTNGPQIITQQNFEYTIVGKEKRAGFDCLKITYTGTTSSEGKFNMQGMEFYIEGTGKATGTFYFAPKIGMLLENEHIIESDMTYASAGENPMTIPVTQKISSVRKLLK